MKLTPDVVNPTLVVLDGKIREFAENLHAAIYSLNQAYETLWNLSDEDLVSLLNSLGTQKVQKMMTEHNLNAVAINSALDTAVADRPALISRLTMRAITEPARQITFENNTFKVVYPPDPITEGPAQS